MKTLLAIAVAFAILELVVNNLCESATVNVTIEETTIETFGPDQASPNGKYNRYLPPEESVKNDTLSEMDDVFQGEILRSIVFAEHKCPDGQEYINGECRKTLDIMEE